MSRGPFRIFTLRCLDVGLDFLNLACPEVGCEFRLVGVHVRTSMELFRPDLSEPSRSGPLPDGPRNGPNRPGPFRAPKWSRFAHALNRKTNRRRPPPEPENLAPRSGPPRNLPIRTVRRTLSKSFRRFRILILGVQRSV